MALRLGCLCVHVESSIREGPKLLIHFVDGTGMDEYHSQGRKRRQGN